MVFYQGTILYLESEKQANFYEKGDKTMTKTFADRVCEQVKLKKSHAVVGLDPVINRIPSFILKEAELQYGKNPNGAGYAFYEFNKMIIDAVCDKVAIVKPQLAYYEVYGAAGIKAFWNTVTYAQEKGLLVIADAKRGDIDSTATAYATSFFDELHNEWKEQIRVDSLTINPYLGDDSLQPFIDSATQSHAGLFILVKTSNPRSGDIQELVANGREVAEKVAEMVNDYAQQTLGDSAYSPVGAVVGATYPEAQAKYRKLMPNSLFLVPGYGTQGAKGKDIVNAFNEDGLGALISASRSIIYAYEQADEVNRDSVMYYVSNAVAAMNEDINTALSEVNNLQW